MGVLSFFISLVTSRPMLKHYFILFVIAIVTAELLKRVALIYFTTGTRWAFIIIFMTLLEVIVRKIKSARENARLRKLEDIDELERYKDR